MSQSGGNTFNTRLEKDASQGNGSDPSQDVTGSATTPPEENTGMAPSTMLAIIIGSVVLLSLCLTIVVWKLCHVRKRKQEKEDFLRKSKGFSDEVSTNSLRLRTIGSHYQLASNVTNDEKEGSSTTETKLTNVEEIEAQKPFLDDDQLRFKNELITENEVKETGLSFLRTPARTRLESTYLDVSPTGSKRSSRSSEVYNMFVVEQRVHAQNAPLASQDPLLSSLTIHAEGTENSLPSRGVLFRNPKERPSSEGNNLDDVAPALPQKMFSKHLNKSAVNVRHNNINTNFQKKANRLLVSKSAGCIPFDEDDDDDFVDISSLPLPPKQRPNLPPKQVINKSPAVLQKIDQNFKKSLPEVRASNASRLDLTRSIIRASDPLSPTNKGISGLASAEDDDYYEPPDYDEPPEPREVLPNNRCNSTSNTRQSSANSNGRQSNSSGFDSDKNLLPAIPAKIKNSYEPEDYDEPVPLSHLTKLAEDQHQNSI